MILSANPQKLSSSKVQLLNEALLKVSKYSLTQSIPSTRIIMSGSAWACPQYNVCQQAGISAA